MRLGEDTCCDCGMIKVLQDPEEDAIEGLNFIKRTRNMKVGLAEVAG
jgi:hypothetical protein